MMISTSDLPNEKWQPQREGDVIHSSFKKIDKNLPGGRVIRLYDQEKSKVFDALDKIPYGEETMLDAVAELICENVHLDDSHYPE